MAKIEIIPESIQLIRMTDEEYFSKKYSEYISNSKLGLIDPSEGGSLEKYLAGYSGDYSESFELGSAVHAMVLQPDDYNIAPIHKPTGKLGLFADKTYALLSSGINIEEAIIMASIEADYYKDKLTGKRLETALSACEPYWKDRKEYEFLLKKETEKNQIYLSSPMYDKYKQCMLGLKENNEVQSTLYPQGLFNPIEFYNEYALLAEVIVTLDNGEVKTLKIKSKLDNFTVNHESAELTLNDLKTTGKPVKFFMGNKVRTFTEETGEQWVWYDGSFQKYHYYRQMGMYLWILSCYYKHKNINFTLKANMIVVETIPDFKTKIFSVNGTQIKKGLDEFKKLLILVANG